MNNRIVRPVRAWAEYDQWSLFYLHWAIEQGDQRTAGWDQWQFPKAGDGIPQQFRRYGSLPNAIGYPDLDRKGGLRSLRVLYDNGWRLRLDPVRGPMTTETGKWFWYLHQEQDAPEVPHGRFTEDKDSEAVERAMIAAAAFFSQRQD